MSRMPGLGRIRGDRWRRGVLWLRPQTMRGKACVSVLAHVAVLFLLIDSWWLGSHRLRPAGTAQGVQTVVAYVPGKTADVPEPRHAAAPPKRRPARTVAMQTASPEPAPQPAAAPGALGNDEVSIARVAGFPKERPDLSGVGQTADIVIDVEIDDTGHVTQAHTRKGIGTGVDAIVIATVEQWIFHPPLRSGVPITSVRELHFHLDRRGNTTGCGWDCFSLAAD